MAQDKISPVAHVLVTFRLDTQQHLAVEEGQDPGSKPAMVPAYTFTVASTSSSYISSIQSRVKCPRVQMCIPNVNVTPTSAKGSPAIL